MKINLASIFQDVPEPSEESDPLFRSEAAKGTCRVMCFSPKSNVTVPIMTQSELLKVVQEWVNQFLELSKTYKWVQIFENKGSIMGCSNPHPHCQIWASSFMPNEAAVKHANFQTFHDKYGKPMLLDYAIKALQSKLTKESVELCSRCSRIGQSVPRIGEYLRMGSHLQILLVYCRPSGWCTAILAVRFSADLIQALFD